MMEDFLQCVEFMCRIQHHQKIQNVILRKNGQNCCYLGGGEKEKSVLSFQFIVLEYLYDTM